MKFKKWFITSIAFIVLISLVSMNATSNIIDAVSSNNYQNTIKTILQQQATDDNYYTWEDPFDNAQKIDESHSENYIVNDGFVEMYGTYPQWTDADWTRMKTITIDSSVSIDDCVIKIIVEYDSDMKSDYSDLRFKLNDESYWLNYWIEEINPEPNDPYGIIWIRIPSLQEGESLIYLFYGNSAAADLSDYWSVFDENSWQNYYAHDHQVTYHAESEGSWDPDVCWGDDQFFVCWEEGSPRYLPLGMIYRQQLRGCFYSEDGERIGSRFDITLWDADPIATFRCEDPASAYGIAGSTKVFFVAYEYYNTPSDPVSRDIKGAIVPTNTDSSDDVSLFDICTATGNQEDPVVAYDDDNYRFFIVWCDAREGTSNYNIYGRLFNANGDPAGPEKIISNRPNSQVEPWVTFDDKNNHYLVVWEEGIHSEDGPFDIWGQLFTVNGDPLGDVQRLSPQGVAGTDYNFPCVAFCSLTERFLVTWQEDDISNDDWVGHIWGKILDENGNVVVNTFKIANGAYERTNIVQHLSSSFFVVFDGNGDVWGKLISSDGDINPYVLQLSDSESDPADWANIGSSGEKIFVAWEDNRIIYVDPYEGLNMPDIYANVWSFNTPSGSDISYGTGEEKSLILESYITSDSISPENIESWQTFEAVKTGDIVFDIVQGNDPTNVLIRDISSGASLQSIQQSSIRLRATFTRENPSTSPTLDKWSVTYVGRDEHAPVTIVENIEGVQGLNDWYISESVIVWLYAEDYPEDTGSGVRQTYYIINDESQQTYNDATGLVLSVSQGSSWTGEWKVTFWSVDNAGNSENRNKPENTRVIKIDADRPYVEITSPANEEQVETPFWVRATPSDNVGIERVEFDIEPFGEREELPYVDTNPPYEWYCDVEQEESLRNIILSDPSLTGVNVMVRAQVYDESGQTWIHEVWVHITNWRDSNGFSAYNCIIIGSGMGTTSYVNDYELIPSCFYTGGLQWQFSSGFCIALGNTGMKSMIGPQFGTASSFTGISLDNQKSFIGFAQNVIVS
jgi:uncharacterized protein DUF2341/Big-like domain-containing protein